MKAIKKILSVAVCLMMALSLMTVVKAADTTTITAPANDHEYAVYQIFTGDLSGTTLSNIKWGTNGKGTTGSKVDQTTLDALEAVNGKTDTEKLDVIETYADLTGTPVGTVTKGSSIEVTTGYYLIKDNGPLAEGEAYSLYMVKVVGPTTISPKTTHTPGFEKKVKDTNDTTGETTGWQDSADWHIGDAIPFQLKATIASDYAEYETYYLCFHDVEEKGLTFNSDSVVVKAGDTTLTAGTDYVLRTNPGDGCTFEVSITDAKKISAIAAGTVVTVDYTATLNDSAVIGSTGNVNTGRLEYTNNPNNKQGGEHGTTPDDTVIVFTWKAVVNKVDGENQPLEGAEFTLQQKMSDGSLKTIGVVKNAAGTEFTFNGLDDGDYVLTETKTPAGYNTIDPITFTVTAAHDIEWTTQKRADLVTEFSGKAAEGKIEFTADKAAGSLTTTVINEHGSTLPETGGMGTTMIYVGGATLMAAAAILLISKKRMATAK